MIDVQSIHCGYGDIEVLREVSLRVESGEMLAVLGPNGSGKTTLLLALAGMIPIKTGAIRVAGEDISRKDSRWIARHISSVPQKTEVTFPFKCLSIVMMGRYPYLDGWGGYSTNDVQAAITAMEQTGTTHLAQRTVAEISGGEAQMIAITRALAQETDILLLDEATSNLDVAKKIQILNLLTERNRLGATLIFVMHDLNLAALYCRRMVFLKNGKIFTEGLTEDVFNEKILSDIYETEIRVSSHPVTGRPQAHFVPFPGSGMAHGDVSVDSSFGKSHRDN